MRITAALSMGTFVLLLLALLFTNWLLVKLIFAAFGTFGFLWAGLILYSAYENKEKRSYPRPESWDKRLE